ncbi:MAG: 16S rRNA (adenine(1518)-N(6)/adenine(1519)-N(6))-dimethyltransferase RsmA [Minisyncoccia bacterium]
MKNRGARLGQHFLNAGWVARDLIASLKIQPEETILEIGPGKGALTEELLATGNPVVAVEKDEALCAQLREKFSKEIASQKLTLIEDDVRNFDPEQFGLGQYVLAANIPYYITGEIIRQFLETKRQPRAAALLMQKEVAERIVAREGKESILSLSVKAYGTPRIIAKVGKGCFNPPPSVDSAILLIENISRDSFTAISERDFFELVRAGFSSKRKLLANNIAHFDGRVLLAACALPEKVRAEDVSLEKWLELAASVSRSGIRSI